jgi:hypothetical protein
VTNVLAFTAYPKTPRLFRDAVITEKLDGTNAAIGIDLDGRIWCQSRKRIITPDDDNFGFAAWAAANAGALVDTLGVGLHFGEWWGSGIQRGYGLTEKRFSLFNVHRWAHLRGDASTVDGLDVVPTLWTGTFRTEPVEWTLDMLEERGSVAAPGFMRPEGVIVYHRASGQVFKALLEADDVAKSAAQAVAA